MTKREMHPILKESRSLSRRSCEMGRYDVGGALSQHLDKAVLAAVVIAIGAYAISVAAGTSEASQLRAKAESAVANVQEASRRAGIPPKADTDFAPELRQAFLHVPASGAEPAWFAFKRPYALRRAEFVSQAKPLHFPPVLEANADVGQVELKWHDSERNENVLVLSYELCRRDSNGKWQKVSGFGPEENAHTDKGLENEGSYTYKLISSAQPEEGAAQFDSPEDAKKESESQTAQTPFNFDVKVSSWSPGRASGMLVVRRPGGRQEDQPFSWRLGSHVVVDGKDTGWVVEKIEENSITIKKGIRVKTFDK